MKLNKSQEEAMELLKTLAKEDRINMEELFILMKAIYENETETITIPSTTPYIPSIPYEPWKPNTPWYWEYPHIAYNTNEAHDHGIKAYFAGYPSQFTSTTK